MSDRKFIKMHGLGNDFVVLDRRANGDAVTPALARAVADRHTGIGCDQVIVIGRSETGLADAELIFFNPDGGTSAACGNGTRCVASLLMGETGAKHLVLETGHGLLDADCSSNGEICIDMGLVKTEWRDIPLGQAGDTLHLGIAEGALVDPVGVSIGNPHAVFFVEDAGAIDLERLGPKLERHEMFPERANIGVAEVRATDRLRLRVWERGAGITRACGSGACAAAVAGSRRQLTDRKIEVELDGGLLAIEWLENGHVLMTGPVATSFTGEFDEALLEASQP
ncbi:MAG: diaminopimelate epimerase [Alphaproteobacteria bacterium]|nr:diaminopimelate epimerase [Alphaproteobacteria bacterium]